MGPEREYIIVLKRAEDLDQFYDDMESRYGDNEIPDRVIELAHRRPLSRSTHYYLTDDEAASVLKDSRVEAVTLTAPEQGLIIAPMTTQTSSGFDKSGTNTATDVNWSLLRGYERTPRASWGSDSTAAQSGTIKLGNIGRNVDVVIIDGHIPLNHPEFAINADGTGGTRINQFNWFQYNQQVRGTSAGTYVYDFLSDSTSIANNNHGCNVGAIAVGNTCGWARGSNVYNISPYSGSTANATGYTNYNYELLDYIKVWHANKPINPVTGRRNPTICNMSYGFSGQFDLQSISEIRYQGITYAKPGTGWTVSDRINFDLVASSGTNMLFYSRDSSIDADCADMVAAGIILVGAAGNYYMYNDRIGGVNYDNYLRSGATIAYYMRGPSPGSATGVINVSAVDATVAERKVDFSNAGPRTDIFAAGTNIMGTYYSGGVNDPRNASYQKGKMSGTSQASPQVTGLIACALETYPSFTAAQALTYIQNRANSGVLDGGTGFSTTYGSSTYLSYNTLYGGPNFYAAYLSERNETNQTFPKKNYDLRPSLGRAYPRNRVRRYG